jgi:hypothetical protein
MRHFSFYLHVELLYLAHAQLAGEETVLPTQTVKRLDVAIFTESTHGIKGVVELSKAEVLERAKADS